MNKTENMIKYSKNKTILTQKKAIEAINEMIKEGETISIYSVRQKTGISKSFLYNNKEVNELIKKHASATRERNTSPEHKELLKAKRDIKVLKAKVKDLEKRLSKYEEV